MLEIATVPAVGVEEGAFTEGLGDEAVVVGGENEVVRVGQGCDIRIVTQEGLYALQACLPGHVLHALADVAAASVRPQLGFQITAEVSEQRPAQVGGERGDRKSTRLNSSHVRIS